MMNYIIYGIHFQLQMNKKFKEKLIYFSKEYKEIISIKNKIKTKFIFKKYNRDIKSSIEINDELHNLWDTHSVTNEF